MSGTTLRAIAFLGSSAASCGLTYLLIRCSVPLRLLAQPRRDRWHGKPTPNTGGLAILFAAAGGYLLWARGQSVRIALCALLVCLLGFLDDRVQLGPILKFAGQSIAAAAVIAGGIVCHATPWNGVNLAITFLWIAGITNAFNLIDNMDGLCAGVAIIICGSRFVLALRSGDAGGALLMTIMAGAVLGFLVFNYRPARIFMGDCGSMFIGFSLAALAMAGPVPHTRVFASTLFYPALTFLYPIFDTTLVSVLRRCAGRPIAVGGRDHSSHRLVSLGLTERRAVWLLWGLAALGAAVGLLTYTLPFVVLAMGILLALAATVFGIFLGTLPAYPFPRSAPVHATWIRRLIPNLRAGVTLVVDALLAGVALLAAFLVRWESAFSGVPFHQFLVSLPVVACFHALASLGFRTFDCGWRWFGARDLFALVRCTFVSAAAVLGTISFFGIKDGSRSVVVLYGFFVLAFTAGLRLWMRVLWQTLGKPPSLRRAVVLGANGTAELAVLVLQRSHFLKTAPVAVIDTNPAADRLRVHGVAVHYVGGDAIGLLRQTRADLLVVPSPDDLSEEHRGIVAQCRAAGVPIEQFDIGMSVWMEDRRAAALTPTL